MSPRRWRELRRHETEELNITAFMNLMVILVPFLLITAVFSRLAIIELNLPTSAAAADQVEEPRFQLEITIRADAIEVGDRNAGVLKRLAADADGHDLAGLSEYLAEIKRSFPDQLDATLLLEPDISYEVLVAVMDRVRVAERVDEATKRVVRTELFPDIAIGDAVLASASN
ncbi:MAG: biopolymer transporter ExbD [Gammaproteobacteria bacterium]|nr:biopolymer transporter ExbD [Gammaproteobacteria bacterium]